MKRIASFLIVSLFLFKLGYSQSDEFVLTWPIVAAEAKKSDEEIANPGKAAKLRTWTERGRKYLEVYTFDLKGAYPAMPLDQAMLIMKAGPKSQKNEGDFLIYSYERIDLYFKDNKLAKVVRTGDATSFFPEGAKPLDIAAEAYIKAKELDTDGKKAIYIGEQLKKVIDLYTSEGYYYYLSGDSKSAAIYFAKIGNILKLKYDSSSDSTRASLLNDCGTVSKMGEKYEDAIGFYTASIAMNPKPVIAPYGDIMFCQKAKGDTAAAIATLLQVIEKFPNDPAIVSYTTELINLYIKKKQYDNALTYLTKALEKEPSNVNFLFNIAYLYETAGKEDLAIQNYKKAIEISPKDEGSNLNLGILYRNKAKTKLDEADAAYGTKNYKPKFDEGKDLLNKAFPYLEVYADIVTDLKLKKDAYKDLASIYAQLGMTEQYNIAKKKMESVGK